MAKRKLVAWDTETALFGPGNMAPQLVCVSAMAEHWPVPALYDHKFGAEQVRLYLDMAFRGEITIVTHNGFYDWAVLLAETGDPKLARDVWRAMDEGLVHDTLVAEWMLDAADGWLGEEPWPASKTGRRPAPKGWYSLARLAQKYGAMQLNKEDGTRVSYGPLRGIAIEDWSEAHKHYAKEDAVATLCVARGQLARARSDSRFVVDTKTPMGEDFARQVASQWALHLASTWGFSTDFPMVLEYEVELKAEIEKRAEALSKLTMPILVKKARTKNKVKFFEESIVETPLIERNEDGTWSKSTKVLKALVERAYAAEGKAPPKTASGETSTAADTIEACDAPELEPWKGYEHALKMLNTYVPTLKDGIVHARYGYAATGRTTSFSPNIQNLPRKGKVRECYVARPGYYLCSVDYGAQELVTFAQAMKDLVGDGGPLLKALNEDVDPHLLFACEQMLGIPYAEGLVLKKAKDPRVADARQKAKAANFGFPGGMGAKRFVATQAKADPPMHFTLEQAESMKKQWEAQWQPWAYFDYVSKLTEETDVVWQLRSNRVRGGVGYSDGANGFFQGLAADMSKDALRRVTRECWLDESSPLFGSRVVAFVHDEIIAEVPIARATEASWRVAELMLAAARTWCPDVKSKAEPAIMRRWYKNAEKVEVNGELVPWEPPIEEPEQEARAA